MRARLCSAHFWSAADHLAVKHTDLSAFRYENKKPSSHSIYREGKKLYAERRGQSWTLSAKRPLKLKDALEELTELFKSQKLMYSSWRSDDCLCLIFSTGIIAYIGVNTNTADIKRILFDRYLVGKLLSNSVSEVLFTDTHILLTYNDNQAILVNFNKPSIKSSGVQKLSKRDPKFQTVELVGGWRRGGRQVSGSVGGGSVLVWSKASPSDLFPWSPRSPNEDHANVHIYLLQGSQMSLQCYHRIEFDPICVSFSKLYEKIVFSVEQKISKKGGVIVECRKLQIGNGNELEECESIRVAAPAPATCAARSPCESFLLLTCSDRSVLLHHYNHNITTTVSAAFVARTCCWWQDGGGYAIMIGGVGSQLQCWDTALAPVHLAPVSDHLPSSSVFDLSSYFRKEPVMTHLMFKCNKTSNVISTNNFVSGDGLLLAIMENGPIVCIRIYAPSTFQGEEGGGGPVYLDSEATAVAKLRTMDWETQGTSCLALLHRIINSLFSRALNAEREELAQAALGTFLAPVKSFPSSIRMTHLPQLHDLCRRFFRHLLRYGRLEKAFSLAIDVGHHDLFMDIKHAAEAIGADDLAKEAFHHAEEVISSCDSSCSRLSCSNCSSSSDLSLEDDPIVDKSASSLIKNIDLYGSSMQNQLYSQVHRSPPPLPYVPVPQNNFTKNFINTPSLPLPKVATKYKFPERDNFEWNEAANHPLDGMAPSDNRVLHRVVEIIPQPVVKSQSALDLFQTELPENASSSDQPTRADRMRFNLNALKSESLLNVYTPVYHQHPMFSGRIPSTISTLPTIPQSFMPQPIKDTMSAMHTQSNRELTHIVSMESIREELPSNNRTEFSNMSPQRNIRLNMPINRNFKNDHMSSSLSQLNKSESNKLTEKGCGSLFVNNNKINPVIKTSLSGTNDGDGPSTKPPGEKNKVKFSDTVTVAVVPEVSRKERRNERIYPGRGFSGPNAGHLDPQRELADSLPLCDPNNEYLKDFAPQPEPENKEKQTKIKVVHFGVV